MLSVDVLLSPAQLVAVKLNEYAILCSRVTLYDVEGSSILAGWYGGAGEMEMV